MLPKLGHEEVKNLKPITIETIYNISKDPFIIVKWQLCCSDILTSSSKMLANRLILANYFQVEKKMGKFNKSVYKPATTTASLKLCYRSFQVMNMGEEKQSFLHKNT